MQIKKLIINSFRGLKDLEFDLNDRVNVFKGANGIGKTTIIDSIMWVLCGETLVYGKQDSDNRNKHDLRDVINVQLELDNGVVLERKYFDNWKEDNDGNLKYVRTENKFFISGANYGKEEYFERIRNDIGLEYNLKTKDFNILRFLMDYNYFGTIDYKVSRKFLEEMLKLKKDEELVREPKYLIIANDMISQKFEIGKVINKYKSQIKLLDSEIETTESKIKDRKSIVKEKELEQLESLLAKRNELLNLNVLENSDYKALEQQIQELGVNIQENEKTLVDTIVSKNNRINELVKYGNELKSKIYQYEHTIKTYESGIATNNFKVEQINQTILKLQNEEFKEIRCYNCNQILNEDEKKTFEENKQERLNLQKNNISTIERQNKELKLSINNVNSFIKELNEKFDKSEKEYNDILKELESLNKQREDNLEVKKMQEQVANLTKEKIELASELTLNRNNLLTETTNKIDYLNTMKNAQNDIETLKQAIKNLKVEKANYEMKIEIVNDFKQMKLDTIKKNIESVFPKLDIQIIEINENTDVMKEVCYARFKDVEYKGMNDGYRYLLGIQIIEDIKKHLGLQDLPIVFDKFADIDVETCEKIGEITKAQIFTTKVEDLKMIKLNLGE